MRYSHARNLYSEFVGILNSHGPESAGLSRTYAELLEGEYDCLDRIVLNAYFRLACRPPGFRVWWRQLYGLAAPLDNLQLKSMAGRFRRCLRTWAVTNGVGA